MARILQLVITAELGQCVTALKPSILRTTAGVKRDSGTGRFIDQKADPKPFKGVRREK